ncbi:hypothetical protein LIER_26556 [Lithospermum erythrorhizon]
MLHYKHWKGDLNVAADWNVQVFKPLSKPPQLLCWNRPQHGVLKVNINGANINGASGLGGIIKNHHHWRQKYKVHCKSCSGVSGKDILRWCWK